MRHGIVRLVFVVSILCLCVALPALAHEHRQVGDYEITFGWRVEPAYTQLFNGPEFTIAQIAAEEDAEHEAEGEAEGEHAEMGMEEHAHDAGVMVEGADETLQLEVTFGDQTKVLALRAVWGEPGHYTADLIPSLPGDYSFRLSGTINGVEIDETFTSADGEFSTVEPLSDIVFP